MEALKLQKNGGVLLERGDVNSIASVIENVNKLQINTVTKNLDIRIFINKYTSLYKDII